MRKFLEFYKKYEEVISYLFFGACTTLCNIVVFYVTYELLHLDLLVANTLAWFLSVLFAYITNRIFVFKSKEKNIAKEIVAFFFARILSLGVDSLIMFVGIDILKFSSLVVKIVANIVVVLFNYIFSKLFIFKK